LSEGYFVVLKKVVKPKIFDVSHEVQSDNGLVFLEINRVYNYVVIGGYFAIVV